MADDEKALATGATRRTVLGAVWAVPVVLAAASAPAAAASGGETNPLGVAANPSSAFIRRGSSSLSAPVQVTVSNNTGRATQGPVTVSVPYQSDTDDVSVGSFDVGAAWALSAGDGLATLVSTDPLADGDSIAFSCRFGSASGLGFATVVGVVQFSIAAPGARTATLAVQVISVPQS
ncbi:hypothetical protein N1031_13495 [Herbiconiux moechotypicola]|uniref:Uncharacterized protein n=1 Tax=Herbiconiux moechotypicola TaxID=637393 RepID=A0ABP5QSX4_9MICO|nr:hypothetical protein [Herbiconiux moechotypicola]MCS5730776.1 hypothetical protein [Herbiconiux moechotypicola]